MKANRTTAVLVFLAAMPLGLAAAEIEPDPICVAEARAELYACKLECTNEFRNERFLCLNVDAGCGRECLGRRESCIEDATEPLLACVGRCRGALLVAKEACAGSCGVDPICRDACVDEAQVAAFVCRDDCRERFRISGGYAAVEACRARYRTCVRACPPADDTAN